MNWSNPSAGIKTGAILFSFLFLFVVAVLLDLQYLYLMAVTLAVLPLASYSLATMAATRFSVQRHHVPTATEDRPPLDYTTGRIAGRTSARGAAGQRSAALGTCPADGWSGPQRPRRLEWSERGPDLSGCATASRRLSSWSLDDLYHGPLGLFNFSATVAAETEVVVHPLPLGSGVDSVGGEGRFGRRERDGKTHRGEGMDFHGVREYRTGDSLRRVHWPTTARTGKISVIEFERAFQRDVIVALDRSPPLPARHGAAHDLRVRRQNRRDTDRSKLAGGQ